MDEIDWMKQFKKGFKYIIISMLVLALLSIGVGLIIYPFNPEAAALEERIMQGIIIIVSFSIFFGVVYGVVWIINKLTNMKIDISFNKEYIRELEKEYPPAMASLIYDLETEVYRDYTATILGLYTKKYININEFYEDVKISKGENENISNLLKHELYVYNCVIHNQTLDEYTFKKLILEDAQENDLLKIEKYKNMKYVKVYIGGLILLIVFIILLIKIQNEIFRVIIILLTSVLLALYWVVPTTVFSQIETINEYKLTAKGKIEQKKIKAFRNFIKDYTLIEEKDIEHIQILEEYIPYSLSLGMSPQVEEYIKNNEIYRNLIYKGRKNWA